MLWEWLWWAASWLVYGVVWTAAGAGALFVLYGALCLATWGIGRRLDRKAQQRCSAAELDRQRLAAKSIWEPHSDVDPTDLAVTIYVRRVADQASGRRVPFGNPALVGRVSVAQADRPLDEIRAAIEDHWARACGIANLLNARPGVTEKTDVAAFVMAWEPPAGWAPTAAPLDDV